MTRPVALSRACSEIETDIVAIQAFKSLSDRPDLIELRTMLPPETGTERMEALSQD